MRIAPRIQQAETRAAPCNTPGCIERINSRADAVTRAAAVRPRKLGHVVLGSTDVAASERFFIDGLGFKVSDTVAGLASFLRCSTDHHNLVQGARRCMHHTSWQVDDVDEIAAATAMLARIEAAIGASASHRVELLLVLKTGGNHRRLCRLDCIAEAQSNGDRTACTAGVRRRRCRFSRRTISAR